MRRTFVAVPAISLLLLLLLVTGGKIDYRTPSYYCNTEICPSRKRHVCCGYSGRFAASCPSGIQLLSISKNDVDQILRHHNDVREKIASGQAGTYPPAARIPELIWLSELQHIAECLTKLCTDENLCKNTQRYRAVNKNICAGTSFVPPTVENVVARCFGRWTDDMLHANQSHVKKFRESSKVHQFTQVIDEIAHQVGCAVARWMGRESFEFRLVCIYNAGNIRNRKTYEEGDLNCTSGTSAVYKHLCSVDEPLIDIDYL